MGEVYRADDLRLGQPVALKFLPAAVNDDPVRLAQFHNEVRIARQVSHRNVCRVYDIGESDGRVFLTMEYVDGEDLATLLRRIGRLPQDKGVEVARQICAGIAAAHEQGVLHRDLKPANIMLDGEGRVRITDFGLAGLAAEIQDIRSGTPAYMAPEQLGGREVSARSDIFALGLVLYEIFTGKRAFDAKNVGELLRMHDEGLHFSPTTSVRDLDPAIAKVIERCLERDPARRPASAIAVSAALPGGDPLAAALAAGETPSPEMVAAAGDIEAWPLRYGLSALAYALAVLAALVAFSARTSYVDWIPHDKSPDVLADRATSVRLALGYRDNVGDEFGALAYQNDYAAWARDNKPPAERWNFLASGRPPTLIYWQRTSPRTMEPHVDSDRPSLFNDPPLSSTGMTACLIDTSGRLLEFHAVTPQHDPATSPAPPPNWDVLFTLAELPRERFTPATPEWTARTYADMRAAWVGTIPELGATLIRLEAASYRGRITYFATIGPWTRPVRMTPAPVDPTQRVFSIVQVCIVLLAIGGAALLARRNLKLGKGDRDGARRVAWVVFGSALVSWVFGARHYSNLVVEQNRFFQGVADALFPAAIFWLIYLAMEPWVRRHWPDCLVGWTRLISRGFRDALVGRDLLVGTVCGLTLFGSQQAGRWVRAVPGGEGWQPLFSQYISLEGLRYLVAAAAQTVTNSPINAVFFVLAYVVLRRILRVRIAAAIGLMLVFSIFMGSEGAFMDAGPLQFALATSFTLIVVATLLRFGLLTFLVMMAVNQMAYRAPWTPDVTAWYATPMLVVVTLTAGLAIFAFVQSRKGAPLFGKGLLEE